MNNNRNYRTGEQTQNIAMKIRKDIVDGILVAGQPLRQQHIAEVYKSSRMPVRDALRILENEGLVDIIVNKGARVAPLDAEALKEIYEMRSAAETLALKIAMPDLTNRHIENAAKIQNEIETGKIENFSAANAAFHKMLYSPCNRPRLLNHIASLSELADRYLRVAIVELNYIECSNKEHHNLLQACIKRDEAKACSILASHIEKAGEALYQRLKATAI